MRPRVTTLDFVCSGAGAGSATCAGAAIMPAAASTALAGAADVLSSAAGSVRLLRSLGFCSLGTGNRGAGKTGRYFGREVPKPATCNSWRHSAAWSAFPQRV